MELQTVLGLMLLAIAVAIMLVMQPKKSAEEK
jgi:hypothetical protein